MTIHSKYVGSIETACAVRHIAPSPARHSSFYRKTCKRGFDICFVIITAPVVLPLTLLFAAMIACRGVWPFYRQLRIGQNGKTFKMLKLRTMVHHADTVLEEHLAADAEARREWETNQKLRYDPRIIKGGRFLRKCSMDELPQFWNVLTGDMSMVGPRPMMVCQQALYPGKAYYMMRPGISGLWQVSKRNDSSFADRAIHDNEYWNTMSFRTDVAILARTVSVVLSGTGC